MKLNRIHLIGGIGGLLPVVVLLFDQSSLADRIDTYFAAPSLGVMLSPILMCMALFGAGLFVVVLHKETNTWKALQLGAAAPALLSMVVSTQIQKPEPVDDSVQKEQSAQTVTEPQGSDGQSGQLILALFPSAHAQSQPANVAVIKTFSMPEETLMEQLVRGFKGSLPERRFYVVHSSFDDLDEAQALCDSLALTGVKAQVFRSGSNANSYRVVLGKEHLDYQEAKSLSGSLETQKGISNAIVEVEK